MRPGVLNWCHNRSQSPVFGLAVLYPTGSEIWCFWYIKTWERKIAMEKTFLLHLSAHWGDLIEQLKKFCHIHFNHIILWELALIFEKHFLVLAIYTLIHLHVYIKKMLAYYFVNTIPLATFYSTSWNSVFTVLTNALLALLCIPIQCHWHLMYFRSISQHQDWTAIAYQHGVHWYVYIKTDHIRHKCSAVLETIFCTTHLCIFPYMYI